MNKTKIDYLTHSWNAIAMRCTPVSRGCAENGVIHCWHLAMAKRLAMNRGILKNHRKAYFGWPPVLNEEELSAPLHLKEPARIGTQFMGDLFHEDVPWDFQIKVFEAMANAGRHTYFILTKRPEGMRKFLQGCEDWNPSEWPHVWLGISVEDQATADERIPILLQIPAAHRWVSIEPMLGRVDFNKLPGMGPCSSECSDFRECRESKKWICHQKHGHESHRIDWVVLGGETGHHARPMHPDWARSVVQQCKSAGVPLFFKSWGEWMPLVSADEASQYPRAKMHEWEDGIRSVRVGHKESGHLIDGKERRELP